MAAQPHRAGHLQVATLLAAVGLAARMAASSPAAEPPAKGAEAIPGACLFTNGGVLNIRLEISPADVASLRRDSRKSVRATLREGKTVQADIGLHLKGSTGSFRSIDDKPGLTLSFDKFVAGQTFHGLRKIHLNNSVEDPSFLNEKIGGELFRAAGVPAPRVGWATVELNGRRLGMYVLKEGFTEDFLGLHFKNTTGNLYEGSGHDVHEPLPRNTGVGEANPSELKALAGAVAETNSVDRWLKLEKVLDMDRFISFMATEVMICHRDGYCLARNNYRIYHDPDSDRMIFLPHGMDQLFGRADTPVQPSFAGLVAAAVIETPEGRRRYRERLGFLTTNIFDPAALSTRADQWAAAIRPVLSGREAGSFAREVAAVKERMVARRACLARLLSEPELKPLQFENGVAMLTNWTVADLPAGGKMEQAKAPDGKPALGIRAGPVTMASWRCKVLLPPGRYRFAGAIATTGVEPLRVAKNKGAGLRIVGVSLPRPHDLTGDHSWTKRQVEFEVVEPTAEKELICELLASKGQAWFDLNSLRLESIGHPSAR